MTANRALRQGTVPIARWLWKALGAIGLILAGWALITVNFWWGVGAAWLGFLLLFVHVLQLETSHSIRRLRYVIAAGVAAALAGFCLVVFRSASLDITATAFPLGEETDLRVYLADRSSMSYGQVDLSVDADAYLLRIVQLSSVPHCTITVSGQPDVSVEVDVHGSEPRRVTIPVGITLGVPRRILCDEMPPGSAIQLDLTTAAKPIAQSSGIDSVAVAKPNRGAHNPPTEVTISGTYTADFRQRHFSRVIAPAKQ